MSPTVRVTPVAQAIRGRLMEIPKLQGRVYWPNIPEGETIPLDERGRVLPYAILHTGGVFRVAARHRGIGSSRDDVKHHTIAVEVVAGNYYVALEVADDVRDKLEGYEPPHCTQMMEDTSGSTKNPVDSTLKPVRYVYPLYYALMISP